MKKFTIEVDTVKALVDSLGLFKSGTNSIRFRIGIADKTANEHPELIASKAVIVNGGMMAEKAFYAVKPEDYDPKESLLYAEFNVKASEFLNDTCALLAYNEDLLFSLQDGTVVVDSGDHATLKIDLVSDEELEPELPQDYQTKALASFAMEGSKFVDLCRRGCGVVESDGGNYTDRAMFSLEKGLISAHSTNTRSMLKAWSDKVQVSFSLNLVPFAFGKKSSSLAPDKQKELGNSLIGIVQRLNPQSRNEADMKTPEGVKKVQEDMKKAQEELDVLAKEYHVELEKFEFFLLSNTLNTLKRVVSGVQQIRVVVTDNYLYCNAGSMMATFTLGAYLEKNFYSSLSMLREGDPVARCIIDTQTFLNGVNIAVLGMSEKSQKSLHITLAEDSLVMSTMGRTIKTPFVEKEGALPEVDCYLSPYELRRVISTMNNGNLGVVFRSNEKLPVEFFNGSLTDAGNSFALVLRVVEPTAAEKASEEDTKEETEETAE